jgi:hypothetical protein
MLRRNMIRIACAVATVAACTVATAFAQPVDKRTLFTFSGPVTLPGVTLPAGQYLFRLADPNTSAKVVQVLSADGTKPYGMFFSMPAERFEPAAKPEVRFMETAAGMPAAIKTWWYPGERTGYEFVYPKEQARRLAQGASQPVLTTQAQTTTTAQTHSADLLRISSTGQETTVDSDTKPSAAAPAGTNQEGTIASSSISIPVSPVPRVTQRNAENFSTRPAATAGTAEQTARARLPKTASTLPLVGLIGLLSIFGAVTLYVWQHHTPMFR